MSRDTQVTGDRGFIVGIIIGAILMGLACAAWAGWDSWKYPNFHSPKGELPKASVTVSVVHGFVFGAILGAVGGSVVGLIISRRPLSDLTAVIIYGSALLFVVFYLFCETSDETWGPGGNFSYEFSPAARTTAAIIAIAFVVCRFIAHLWRCLHSNKLPTPKPSGK